MQRLRRLVPQRYKGPLLAALGPRSDPRFENLKGRRKVFVMLAGFYQNLGDMALTYAQTRIIRETLPEYEVVLIPSVDTFICMRALRRVVGPDDIITIIGGGNMDDVYSSLENARLFVVRSFPNNPIVSFPQTISFSEMPSGRRALARSARAYCGHRNLVMFGRERQSVEVMREAFPGVRVEASPDTVLSLGYGEMSGSRAGAMMMVRDDVESVLSRNVREMIATVVEGVTDDVVVKDTVDVTLEDCQPDRYEQALGGFWELLRSRRVAVTDRLHGMIFCAITRTPVVVLPNSNHKISGTYDAWLKEDPCIRFLGSYDYGEFNEAINSMWDLGGRVVPGHDLTPSFEPIREALRKAAGR